MSMGFRYATGRVLWEFARARASLDRTTDRLAHRDAAHHPDVRLAGFLRDHARHPWRPPVGGLAAALGHDVVHGLDVTVALGADLHGVRLCAEDLDRSFGTGEPLYGTAQDLLLIAYGRRLPAGRPHGADCHRFVAA
ncbi:hypothetical protein [Streptomyces lincolnensis]|uniref:hypothetical protein n=1 Tax=Streptomyces lincolnensis TaxID=1915 RepID=UPI0037D30AE1